MICDFAQTRFLLSLFEHYVLSSILLRCTTKNFYQDFVEMVDAMLCNDLSFFMQTQIKSFNIHKCAHVIWMVFIYNNQSTVPLPSIPDLKRELIVLLHVNCYHMLVKYWQVAGQIIQNGVVAILNWLYNGMKNST